jgi:nitroreductase
VEFKRVVGLRRSIRFYKPYRPVEREKVQTILEAARLASRAVNAAFAKAIVVFRDEMSEDDRAGLKMPTTTTQLDLAPVWIFWYGDLDAIKRTDSGRTLRELIDVGALAPTHGWTYRYVDDVVWGQMLGPMSENPEAAKLAVLPDAGVAICQALLCAVDEGLGTQLTGFNPERAKRILGVPDSWFPLYLQLVGYPAEEPEAGGQRPREPFEEDFFEGKYGRPFPRDEAVVERLKREGMIQAPAPLPWRRDELRALARMFDLPE